MSHLIKMSFKFQSLKTIYTAMQKLTVKYLPCCFIAWILFLLTIQTQYNSHSTNLQASESLPKPQQPRNQNESNNLKQFDSNKCRIIIVSRRRSGSSWFLRIVSSLLNEVFSIKKSSILSLFETDHITSLNNFKPFLNSKKTNWNLTMLQKIAPNIESTELWDNLDTFDKVKYHGSIVNSILHCNLTNNFAKQIGMHHSLICSHNNIKSCNIINIETRCIESDVILLKSVYFDARSIKYITSDIKSKILYLVLIRNPLKIIISNLRRHWYDSIQQGIDDICIDFCQNTVLPLLSLSINNDNYNNRVRIQLFEYEKFTSDFNRTIVNLVQYLNSFIHERSGNNQLSVVEQVNKIETFIDDHLPKKSYTSKNSHVTEWVEVELRQRDDFVDMAMFNSCKTCTHLQLSLK